MIVVVALLLLVLIVGVLAVTVIFALTGGPPRTLREERRIVVVLTAALVVPAVLYFHLGFVGLVAAAASIWIFGRMYGSDGEPWHPGLLDPPGYGDFTEVNMTGERYDRNDMTPEERAMPSSPGRIGRRRLTINPEPIRVVDDPERRDVWFTTPEQRERKRRAQWAEQGTSYGRYDRAEQDWIYEEFMCHPDRRVRLALPETDRLVSCPICGKRWRVQVEPWGDDAFVKPGMVHHRVTWERRP